MRLNELRDLITSSDPDRWHTPVRHGGSSYRVQHVTEYHEPTDSVETTAREQPMLAVLEEDIDVSIAWGIDPDEFDDARASSSRTKKEQKDFPWLADAALPDESVSLCLVEVFYRGALVDSDVFAYVDGARALLPYPIARDRGAATGGRRMRDYEWVVTEWQVGLARVLNGISSASEFDRYFDQVPYTVE